MVNIPFLGALAGCSARRSERRVASHTSEEQRRNAPSRAVKNGILAFSASLSVGADRMALLIAGAVADGQVLQVAAAACAARANVLQRGSLGRHMRAANPARHLAVKLARDGRVNFGAGGVEPAHARAASITYAAFTDPRIIASGPGACPGLRQTSFPIRQLFGYWFVPRQPQARQAGLAWSLACCCAHGRSG